MKKEGSRKKAWIFLIIALVLIVLVAWLFLKTTKTCDSYICFQEAMANCKQATYVNDDVDATWKYDILGIKSGECSISVKLVQDKGTDVGAKELEGLDMTCSYPEGISAYPQKDLSRCHGILKEEMQSIVITNLHQYIISNLGKLDNKLNSPVYLS